MPTCASCGHELPAGAKCCLECGAPVSTAAPSREQRKTVTILFCDVAGSTALGEPTDSLEVKADARYDLAVVLVAAGKNDEALEALDEAQALYAQKGHTVGVARVDEMRSELVASLEA